MSDAPHEEPEAPPQQGSDFRAALVHHTATTVLLVAAIALGVWGYLEFNKKDFFSFEGEKDRRMEQQLIASQERKLTFAVDTYQKIHNEPPSSFEALELEGLITSLDLAYPSKHIVYELVREDGRVRARAVAQPASATLPLKMKKKANKP